MQNSYFSSRNEKQKKCTINMFCLSSPHYTTMPTTQKQRYHAAVGLGKKRIENRDGDRFDFLGTLQEEYPKLAAAGESFYLYKAASGGGGSRLFEWIPPGPSNYSAKCLGKHQQQPDIHQSSSGDALRGVNCCKPHLNAVTTMSSLPK